MPALINTVSHKTRIKRNKVFILFLLHLAEIEVIAEDEEKVSVRVGAGVVWDDFVAYCVDHGWYGTENLSLIPGEVGASAVQNIGAYGVEVKDMISFVETMNIEGVKHVYRMDECEYSYRNSIFKRPEMKQVFSSVPTMIHTIGHEIIPHYASTDTYRNFFFIFCYYFNPANARM